MRQNFVPAPRRWAAVAALCALFAPGSAFADDSTQANVDLLWIVVASALVFVMQFGFLAFEVGCVRSKNMVVTAMKNLGDWLIVSVFFFLGGFGLMYGESAGGAVGTNLFLGIGVDAVGGLGWTFFLFQLTFAGTAATIVSGAMAERTGFKPYLLFTVFMALVIYPIFGHWVWGSGFVGTNEPWLAGLGYLDFAGSSVVHIIGAGAALVGVKMVGPRLGRFGEDGSVREMESGSLMWSCLGVLVLWFGWFGFNGGSTLKVDASIGLIIVNTNLAAATAGIIAFSHAQLFQSRRNTVEKTLGGIIGGLVAITACANVVSPIAAVALGAVAGLVHNLSYELVLYKWRLDDVVGAIPAHGFCGVWGILSVAIFGDPTKIEQLGGSTDLLHQLGVQAGGALTAIVWGVGASLAFFMVLKNFIGLRVDPMREIRGLSLSPNTGDEDDQEEDLDDLFEDDDASISGL